MKTFNGKRMSLGLCAGIVILTNDNEECHFDDFHLRTRDDASRALPMQRAVKDVVGRAPPRATLPKLLDDEAIAAGDDGDGDEEEEERDEGHVELPVPLLVELNPALRVPLNLDDLVEEELRK